MHLKEFFYFPKSDRLVILTLASVALVCIALIWMLGSGTTVTPMTDADTLSANDFFLHDRNQFAHRNKYYYGQYVQTSPQRFPFDPNTADSTQLLSLGLRPWQVRNIYKYRSKGGIYRQKSDFARLYGLSRKEYKELEPYIVISADYEPASADFPVQERDSVRYPVKLKESEHIDLNTADTSILKRVPGIGSYYARQVINYRNRLGGYVSKEQLLEIEYFPEEALPFIEINTQAVNRLNLNKLTLNQLKRHPYISFYQARAITDYRRLHGSIESLDDLKLLKEFPQAQIDRLRPYVEF